MDYYDVIITIIIGLKVPLKVIPWSLFVEC